MGPLSLHNAEQSARRTGRPRKIKPVLTFIVDSREQLPYTFTPPRRREFADGGSMIAGLGEGDYSVALDGGNPLPIRLERKSEGDLFGVCGFGRERFQRELERLCAYRYRGLIIECSAGDVLRGFERSQIPGRTVLASVLAWSVSFGLHVFFCGSRAMARGITQRILEQYAIEVVRKSGAAG